jgi:hypothetical protein
MVPTRSSFFAFRSSEESSMVQGGVEGTTEDDGDAAVVYKWKRK